MGKYGVKVNLYMMELVFEKVIRSQVGIGKVRSWGSIENNILYK